MRVAKWLTFFCLSCMGSLYALPSDNEKPLSIKSETATLDLAKGIAIHRGHVTVHQGTRRMSGEVLKIYRQSENRLSKITMRGNPARYHAKPKANKPPLYAEAKLIIYNAKDDTITLKNNAKLQQGDDKAEGPGLIYSAKTQTVTSLSKNHERTTLTIHSKHPLS